MAFMSWPVSDPTASRFAVGKALMKIVQKIEHFVREEGHAMIFSVGTTPQLTEMFNKLGFNKGESNTTTMIKVVDYPQDLIDYSFNVLEELQVR